MGRDGERGLMAQKAQHASLRFAKHKAGPAGALEAHHERTKEQYASNPDITYQQKQEHFHIIQPTQKYRRELTPASRWRDAAPGRTAPCLWTC